MPRRKVTFKGRRGGRYLSPGVRAAIPADQLLNDRPATVTGARYGVDPVTVRRIASSLNDLDPEEVGRISRGMAGLYSILAARFGLAALERVDEDPSAASKLMFSSKMAMESHRLAQPAGQNAGATVMAFINALSQAGGGSLTVGPPAASAGPVLEAGSVSDDKPPALSEQFAP